ncbi:unnamed protein product [Mytilus edulis]|uniref:Uncharacterized protein n=1 Tax=Mytilus edulis TaxID=6550 RepID=A0A8S3QL68_MYTED|nr:unnamed protein product [Mytilus edulis]
MQNTLKEHLLNFVKSNESRQNICFNDQMLKILQTTALYHSVNQRQALALADQKQMVQIISTLSVDTKYYHELTNIKIPLLQRDRKAIIECLASVIHDDVKGVDETSAVIPYSSETLRDIEIKPSKITDTMMLYSVIQREYGLVLQTILTADFTQIEA